MKITFSKKAGLQMSINAIVVLVMAMVVLGLGLGFIRGMFSSAEDKFSGAIDNVELTNPPTALKPLTFEKSTYTVKKGASEEFMYSVYNNQGSVQNSVTLSIVGCAPALQSTHEITITSVAASIPDGSYTTFMGLIDVLSASSFPAAGSDTYVCTLGASSATNTNFASAQITIKIS